MENIEAAIERAKTVKVVVCPNCQEELYSPMDRLSVTLYQECLGCVSDNEVRVSNLFELVEKMY